MQPQQHYEQSDWLLTCVMHHGDPVLYVYEAADTSISADDTQGLLLKDTVVTVIECYSRIRLCSNLPSIRKVRKKIMVIL